MAQSYFIWNGMDCRSMGVRLAGPVAIVRPEERVQHVEIPGRSGDLTELEGENIYNSYIQTASILMHGGYRARDVFRWLRGSGYVTFSGEPDRRQQARVIGAITLNKHSYNLDWYEGEVQFYCQPLKEKLAEEKVTMTASGSVMNYGDVQARPMIKVTCSGLLFTLTVNGKNFTVSGIDAGTYYVDCETMEVWNGTRTALLTGKSSGTFPMLKPGANTVSWLNVSSLEITKRERFL